MISHGVLVERLRLLTAMDWHEAAGRVEAAGPCGFCVAANAAADRVPVARLMTPTGDPEAHEAEMVADAFGPVARDAAWFASVAVRADGLDPAHRDWLLSPLAGLVDFEVPHA